MPRYVIPLTWIGSLGECKGNGLCYNLSYLCTSPVNKGKNVLDNMTNALLITADRNECTEIPCHINASCINTLGSFYCDCDTGFLGNGIECEGKHIIPMS